MLKSCANRGMFNHIIHFSFQRILIFVHYCISALCLQQVGGVLNIKDLLICIATLRAAGKNDEALEVCYEIIKMDPGVCLVKKGVSDLLRVFSLM